jgi:hypothetical protein
VAVGEQITVQLGERWAAGEDAPVTAAAPAGRLRDAQRSGRAQAQARPVAAVALGPEPEPEPAFDRARTRSGGPPGPGAVGGPPSAAETGSPSSGAPGSGERGGKQQDIAWARAGLYPIVTLQYSSTTLYQVSYHIW